MSFDDWTHEGQTTPPSPETPLYVLEEPPTPDLFLLDPQMAPLLDGDKRPLRLNPFGMGCLLLFLLPFYLAGIGVPVGFAYGLYTEYRLNSDPVTTQARVLGTRVDQDDDSTSYLVKYSYQANGQTLVHESSVGRHAQESSARQGVLDVTYCRTRPSLVRAAGESRMGLVAGGFVLAWVAIWDGSLTLFTMAGLRGWRRHRRLWRGEVVGGIVTSASGANDSDGDYQLTVNYRFESPQGSPLEGKTTRQRNVPAPLPGTPVAVLYADDQTHQLL